MRKVRVIRAVELFYHRGTYVDRRFPVTSRQEENSQFEGLLLSASFFRFNIYSQIIQHFFVIVT